MKWTKNDIEYVRDIARQEIRRDHMNFMKQTMKEQSRLDIKFGMLCLIIIGLIMIGLLF